MEKEELETVLANHALWLKDEGGECAYLRGANLRNANLRFANLRGAYLNGADLHGAYLRGADLRNADLRGADLRNADLRNAYLRNANLRCANLSGARLNWQSHALLSEILRREAKSLSQRSVAGIVATSLDWCWTDFSREFDKSQKSWAVSVLAPYVLSVLAPYVQEGDDLPDVFKEML